MNDLNMKHDSFLILLPAVLTVQANFVILISEKNKA